MFRKKEALKQAEPPKTPIQNLDIGREAQVQEPPKELTLAEQLATTTEIQFREYVVIQLEEILARVKVIENEATRQ